MRIGLVSNWGNPYCGVSQFGRNFATALIAANHEVVRLGWNEPAEVDHLLVNWDSGTLPVGDPLPLGCTVLIHHVYRGQPEGLDNARLILSPMRHVLPRAVYFPYPVPTYRAPAILVEPKTIGVTTLRKEGVDYLQTAAGRIGYRVYPPDRWRETDEEIERLATCELLALWYTDSPGRSLALATSLAAQRPILLSASQMFEYALGSDEVYSVPYTNQDMGFLAETIQQIGQAAQHGTAKIPERLAAEWSWPVAIATLETLWSQS